MATQRFEDLQVWREGIALNIKVYESFKDVKEYWLREQILRSVLSIPSNIAEGYDRISNKECIRFLSIARASCSELRTQLIVSEGIKVVPEPVLKELILHSNKISAMLFRLISVRRTFVERK